jgi:hypothetical protein
MFCIQLPTTTFCEACKNMYCIIIFYLLSDIGDNDNSDITQDLLNRITETEQDLQVNSTENASVLSFI